MAWWRYRCVIYRCSSQARQTLLRGGPFQARQIAHCRARVCTSLRHASPFSLAPLLGGFHSRVREFLKRLSGHCRGPSIAAVGCDVNQCMSSELRLYFISSSGMLNTPRQSTKTLPSLVPFDEAAVVGKKRDMKSASISPHARERSYCTVPPPSCRRHPRRFPRHLRLQTTYRNCPSLPLLEAPRDLHKKTKIYMAPPPPAPPACP